MKRIVLLLCLLFSVNLFAQPLSLEHFANLPDVSLLGLSPDGKKLSSVIRIDAEGKSGMAVQVVDLASGDKNLVLFTDNRKYDIYWVQWKDNRTLLVGVIYPSSRNTWLGLSRAVFKTRETSLLIVDTQSGDVSTPFKKSFLKKYKIAPTQRDRVIDMLPDDPEHILMELPTNQSLVDISYTGVYKVNIRKQTVQQVQSSEHHVYSWMTDQQHRVRLGHYHDKDGLNKVLVNKPDTKGWMELWPYKIFSEDEVHPLGFGADPMVLYIRAYHEGFMAVFRVNLNDPQLKRELVYADPNYDVSGTLIYSPVTRDVVGIGDWRSGVYTFFDPDLNRLQAGIDKALPETRNRIIAFSKDMQTYVLLSQSSTDSGTYYLGQRNPAKLDAVAYRYKHLTPDLMSPVKRYDYKARDGLAIEAYLTLPRHGADKKLPTIIFPHGGPISRNDDSFNYWSQFFANKGFAVLQMNFRGSSGQGLEFRNAGLKNWGQEMQDDVEDGVRKLIADGISDPQSICIFGASYGGYAALMGAVKTPDLYRCAVSVAGVSNVFDLVKDNRAYWRGYNVVDEQIGNDNKHLRAISPVNHADKIKIPVLLIHGDSDRQVDIKHSIQMRDALQKAGKKVTFLELANEDHYLTNNDNRLATFRAIDAFLDEHLARSSNQQTGSL